MKFAVPLANGKLTAHFGHCQEFAIVEVEDGRIKKQETLVPPPHEPGVDKSCYVGHSSCDGERYGPCVPTYRPSCSNIHLGTADFRLTDENSSNVITGVDGEITLDPEER